MKIEIYKLNELTPYAVNPRLIDEYKFDSLKNSIAEFPKMMGVRCVVINKEKEILCGNMRYRACVDLGYKDVPALMVDMSLEKQKELVIKDNLSYGEWDWDMLDFNFNSDVVNKWLGRTAIDYSALDYEEMGNEIESMTDGVKHAIQITIDADQYDNAKELEKRCRELKLYIGGNLLTELQNTLRHNENN